MCTPRHDITLDRFMRIAHLLPCQRGNVPVDNHTFVNALLWMCRTGAPWRDLPECYGKWITVLPAVQPLVQERRDRAPVHGIAGGVDHRGGDPGARHGPHEREGPPARGRGAEKRLPVSRRLPGRTEHGRTRLQPHEALPQGRHPLRQARRDLPRRPPAHPHRHLPEKHSQKPN